MAAVAGAFLFTDLVGSTALSSSLGHTEADRLRQTHFGLLRFAAHMMLGDLDAADQSLDEVTPIADTGGDPTSRWCAIAMRSTRLLLAGRLADAEEVAEDAMSFGMRIGAAEALGAYASQLLEIRLHQGRTDEVTSLVSDAARRVPTMAALRAFAARAHSRAGQLEHARALLATDAGGGFAAIPPDLLWLNAIGSYAEAAVDVGDLATAEALARQLAPYSGIAIATIAVVLGATARLLGRVDHLAGRLDQAERHFEAALDLHHRLQAPFWIARTQLDHAALLIDRGRGEDRRRAKALVDDAMESAAGLGYAGLEREGTGLTTA